MNTAFCFDLDGTLTTTELLPCIAAELGISEEIATLTRVTMEGLITFEESMRLRIAILGQVPVRRVHAIIEDIGLDPVITSFIRSRREESFVVTGNLDIWVLQIVDRLGCRGYFSKATVKDNHVVLGHILNKGDAVKAIRQAGFERVVAVGDGSNDVPMFVAADVAIAFGGTHSPTDNAIHASHYVIHNGDSLCSLLNTL